MRWVTLLATMMAASVCASERTVWGKVIDVQPVTRQVEAAPDPALCNKPRPDREAGLTALLAWDLSNDCAPTTREAVTAYDVTYRWGNRRYKSRRKEHPGERIALRVSVQPSFSVR